jgi:leucyl aminopeptidase
LELSKQVADKFNLKLDYLVGKDLEKEGLNLLYNVGRGASKAPVLAVMKYEGNPDHPEDLIALVGKGVCFDAGGLNIKPTGGIEEMYADKGGSACVFSAFYGICDLKLPVNVVLGTFFVENLLGSDSYHPNDILTSYKGLTVEIGNTDAEGRLCLADTMTYVQKYYKPHTLVEYSTLTGACVVGLVKVLKFLIFRVKTRLECGQTARICTRTYTMHLTSLSR